MASPYRFQKLALNDLPLLRRWLDAPHVQSGYGGPEELTSIRAHLSEPDVTPYLVLFRSQPIAYLQAYAVHGTFGHPYQNQPFGAVGIDQFIGPRAFLHEGHGPAFIRHFSSLCFRTGVPRMLVDPQVDNAAAIKAYKRAGFGVLGPRQTKEDGHVLLMGLDPNG